MPFQPVGGMSGFADGMLQREDEQPIGTQRARAGRNDVGQVTEIDQRVRRHDQVEGFAVIAQILGQLRLDQRVVDVLLGCLLEHSLRQVHAGERSCKRRDERAAQPGPASRVEHVETVRRVPGRSPQASRRSARVRGRTALRVSIQSSPRSCRRLFERTRPTHAPARPVRCRPPACAARPGRPAPRRAIPRRCAPPRRLRPACNAPSRAACARRDASAST